MIRKISIVDYGMGNLFSVCRAVEHCGAEPVLVDSPEAVIDADILILPGVGAFADAMANLRAHDLVEPIRVYARSGRPMLGICLGMQMLLDGSEEFCDARLSEYGDASADDGPEIVNEFESAGMHRGLGLIPGRVAAIPPVGIDGRPHKIPHIGWNELIRPRDLTSAAISAGTGLDATDAPSWADLTHGTILEGIPERTPMYFVHSFTAYPDPPPHNSPASASVTSNAAASGDAQASGYRLADCDYNGQCISAVVRTGNVYGTQFHPEKSGPLGLQILRNFMQLRRLVTTRI